MNQVEESWEDVKNYRQLGTKVGKDMPQILLKKSFLSQPWVKQKPVFAILLEGLPTVPQKSAMKNHIIIYKKYFKNKIFKKNNKKTQKLFHMQLKHWSKQRF